MINENYKKYKIYVMLAAVLMLTLCAGCSTQRDESNSESSSSSMSDNLSADSSSFESDSLSSSISSVESDASSDFTISDSSSSFASDTSGMSYMEYLHTYRNDIIDGAIDVMYEHFIAHPTGLKDGYVRFDGEIVQVLEGETRGYEYYDILMNITYVPDVYEPYYTDSVVISLLKEFTDVRPSVGDLVTISGISRGILPYENLFGEQVSAPYVMAAQILYNSHTDTEPTDGITDFAATKMLGLTVDEIAVLRGHSPSDYIVEDGGNDNMAFHADDGLILYSLSGYTSGTVRAIEILSGDIKISDGYGTIDNVCIGMTETEFLDTVTDRLLDSYGIEGLYMVDVGNISFTFIFNKDHKLSYCEVANYNIIF